MMQAQTFRAIAAILPAVMFLVASAARADEGAKTFLPGVQPQQPIASHEAPYPPEPEPMDRDIDGTSFEIGKMKVHVHGYISYAVGFGKPLPGKGSRSNYRR